MALALALFAAAAVTRPSYVRQGVTAVRSQAVMMAESNPFGDFGAGVASLAEMAFGKQDPESASVVSDPISSLDMRADGTVPNGVLLSMDVRAREGKERAVADALEKLKAQTGESKTARPEVLSISIGQDPEDPTHFMVFEHFFSTQAMTAHQGSPAFKAFLASVEPLLSSPLGLHLAHDRDGKISEAVYPFGPTGEGGRDDMARSARPDK